jgi:hypothetical protein
MYTIKIWLCNQGHKQGCLQVFGAPVQNRKWALLVNRYDDFVHIEKTLVGMRNCIFFKKNQLQIVPLSLPKFLIDINPTTDNPFSCYQNCQLV